MICSFPCHWMFKFLCVRNSTSRSFQVFNVSWNLHVSTVKDKMAPVAQMMARYLTTASGLSSQACSKNEEEIANISARRLLSNGLWWQSASPFFNSFIRRMMTVMRVYPSKLTSFSASTSTSLAANLGKHATNAVCCRDKIGTVTYHIISHCLRFRC